jgi:hypothetical protein
MPKRLADHPVLAAPLPPLEPQECETRYNTLCHWYFGRELHDHARVRRRTLDLLTDVAVLDWPRGCAQAHCGLSADFLTLVTEGLRDGVDVAMARAEDEGRGRLAEDEWRATP